MAAKKGLDLSGAKVNTKQRDAKPAASEESKPTLGGAPLKLGDFMSSDLMSPQKKATAPAEPEDKTPAEDDDEILSAVSKRDPNKNNLLFVVAGVGVVMVIVICFLLFGGRGSGNDNIVQQPAQQQPTQQQPTQQPTQQAPNNGNNTQSSGGQSMGAQDFTGNTTMTNSDILTNPDKYVQDIYGLTTRVDYTVSSVKYVADFVSYTKHRGTWGGGLELYWLDVEYQGSKYVVQVPFVYYKELTAEGIVPVKMEVLTIEGAGAGETLTVVSYMCLDEQTLKSILQSQTKK